MEKAKNHQLIIFDVNETLLDMSPIKNEINHFFEKEYAFKQWFSFLLQFSLVEMVTDSYHNFSEIGDAALEMVAQAENKNIPEQSKKEILSKMASLQAHQDVEEGLSKLKEAGYRLATLTNSAQKVADKQLVNAGIDTYFEKSLSVESMKMFKPKLETYSRALKELSASANETLFVAAHGWDISGAARAGLSTAFIEREGKALYPLAPSPTYKGKTLIEIARQLVK